MTTPTNNAFHFAGFKRMAMGDYLGSRRHFGACCACGSQFMSTREMVYVPERETANFLRLRHNPACEHCARKLWTKMIKKGDRVSVEYNGLGEVVSLDEFSVLVKLDDDGDTVSAGHDQVKKEAA